jgi:hypothetical protein
MQQRELFPSKTQRSALQEMKSLSNLLLASAATAALVATAAVTTSAVKPPDLPCVTWERSSYYENTPPVDTLFVSGLGWVIGGEGTCDVCLQKGDLIPCWSDDSGVDNTWGHHDYLQFQIPNDYCRIWDQGQVYYANNFYLPKKGPKYETWKFVLTQTGATVPANAIRMGDKVMAASTQNVPGCCAGKNFLGWADAKSDNTFGNVHFAIQEFEVLPRDARQVGRDALRRDGGGRGKDDRGGDGRSRRDEELEHSVFACSGVLLLDFGNACVCCDSQRFQRRFEREWNTGCSPEAFFSHHASERLFIFTHTFKRRFCARVLLLLLCVHFNT